MISVIPVVVAKCGLYLKENATMVEGTFRVSGSEKRMRDLQLLFDTGPKVCIEWHYPLASGIADNLQYGKDIDWKNLPYTTHDVGTIFRRYVFSAYVSDTQAHMSIRFLTQMPVSCLPVS